MKKSYVLLALASVSLALIGATELPALTPFVRAMQSAPAINASYQINDVGGGEASYSIAMAKPNFLRFESATNLIVADGAQITYLDKSKKIFYKTEQTQEKLLTSLSSDESILWRPFFDSKALDGAISAKNSGKKTQGGRSLTTVDAMFDKTGESKITLYLDSETNMLAKAQMGTRQGNRILSVESLEISAPTSLFTFTAPKGAREMTEEEMAAGKWYHNWDEAMNIAKATGKVMMVDFYAVWCGPCKMMDAEVFQTEQFKNSTKDFVLVKIDAEVDVALAKKYGIEAYPTVKFINNKGAVVHEYVGYGGPQGVYDEVAKARTKR